MDYVPQQRTVSVRILTSSGWLAGDLHPPEKACLVDWLNRAQAWLHLTDVRLNAQVQHVPFFALRREAAWVIVPPDGERELEAHLATEPLVHQPAQVLMEFGVAFGTVQITAGVRISDFLRTRPDGFIVVEESRWVVRAEGGFESDALRRAIVGTRHVLGVSDGRPP